MVRERAREIERDLELRAEDGDGAGEGEECEKALMVVGCSVVASLEGGDAELGSEGGEGKDREIEVEVEGEENGEAGDGRE